MSSTQPLNTSQIDPDPTQSTQWVGITPRLPGRLGRSAWWNEPIPAEPLAALRILVGSILLLDQLTTWWPHFASLFGTGSTGDPELFAWFFEGSNTHWSVLRGIGDIHALRLSFGTWVLATVAMIVGWNTRLATGLVWVLSVSFNNLNLYSINAGDHICGILLLYLMITPCAAVWSLDARISGSTGSRRPEASRRVVVHPWAIRLLFIQFAFMYGASGLCKCSGDSWSSGESLYYVMNDLSLTRFSAQTFPIPFQLTQIFTWTVLAWEVLFPILIAFRRLRRPALWFGVAMHLNIFLTMDLGCFPLYVLAAYVPLIWCSHPSGEPTDPFAFLKNVCRTFLSKARCSLASVNACSSLQPNENSQCLSNE
ncbi:MAG: HTTM domain-containing protein [Planctomycetota bacterium]